MEIFYFHIQMCQPMGQAVSKAPAFHWGGPDFDPRPVHIKYLECQVGQAPCTSDIPSYRPTNAAYSHCIQLAPTLYNLSYWRVVKCNF